jgi:hypothetical protein
MDEYLNFINELNEEELKIFIFRQFFKLNGSKVAKLLKINRKQSYIKCKRVDNLVLSVGLKRKLIESYNEQWQYGII